MMSVAGPVACMCEERNVQGSGGGQNEGKSTLIEAWEENTKVDIIEVGWKSVEWSYQAEDRHKWRAVVHTVMNVRTA